MLPSIPRDEEFKFKERAHALVHKWQMMILEAEVQTL